MDLEVEILDTYIFALFTQIKILHNVIFLTKMDLKVKILDIFIFLQCSPLRKSLYRLQTLHKTFGDGIATLPLMTNFCRGTHSHWRWLYFQSHLKYAIQRSEQ